MKKTMVTFSFVMLIMFGAFSVQAATIGLFDWGFNLDGTSYCSVGPCDNVTTPGGLPGSINVSTFDFGTGIGTLGISVIGAGNHSVVGFFDHEIDEALNSFFNETGAVSGIAAAGQFWEIDEPGFLFGDIYDNFLANTLDNSIGTAFPDDVSMAMAGTFALAAGDEALLSFILSETMPSAGFYLTHTDPDSQASIYFSGDLTIDRGTPSIPEPGTLLMLGTGLIGLYGLRRKISV